MFKSNVGFIEVIVVYTEKIFLVFGGIKTASLVHHVQNKAKGEKVFHPDVTFLYMSVFNGSSCSRRVVNRFYL